MPSTPFRAVEFTTFAVSKGGRYNNLYADNCGYSVHKCRGVNHYDHECPRDTYRGKIVDLVKNRALPLNPVSNAGPAGSPDGRGSDTATAEHRKWVSDTCGSMREKRYEDSVFWDVTERDFPITKNRESLYDRLKD